MRTFSVTVIAALSLAGCLGSISEGPDPETPGGGPGGSNNQTGKGGQGGTVNAAFIPPEQGLRLLTAPEYTASIRDLLGADIVVTAGIPSVGREAGYSSVAAVRAPVKDAKTVSGLLESAMDVAAQAITPARRAALVPCNPTGPGDTTCATSFVTRFGRLAFRRPLDSAESARYVRLLTGAAADGQDFWAGVEATVTALLFSPAFLYRPELGVPGAAPSDPRQVRGYEMASRLSYLLAGTTPPGALLDAAASGKLDTFQGVLEQAQALLASRGAEVALLPMLEQWQHLSEIAPVPRLTASLRMAMEEETRLVLRDLAGGKVEGGLAGAMETRTTYVNDDLARHYGLAPPGSPTHRKVALPADGARAGLLGHGSFLAGHVGAGNVVARPIYRSVALLEIYVCNTDLAPPADLDTGNRKPPNGGATARDHATDRMDDKYCGGCHRTIDPIGLAFENFDEVAKYRATEGTAPIDPSGKLFDVSFADAVGAARAIAAQPLFAKCMATQMYRHATGRVEQPGQQGRIGDLGTGFSRQAFDVRSLLLALVADPLFTTVGGAP